MITATLTYIEPNSTKLSHFVVDVLGLWSLAGRTWAEVRAGEDIFPGLCDGHPYVSDWTIVDNSRLRDIKIVVPPPAILHRRRPIRPHDRLKVRRTL